MGVSLQAVMFSHRLTMAGMMFIQPGSAQMAAGLLMSAIYILVQAYLNPFQRASSKHMANLLFMSLFLTLLVGGHKMLLDSDKLGSGLQETTDATGMALMLVSLLCFVIAACVLIVDAYYIMMQERAAYKQKVIELKQRAVRPSF